MSLICISRFSYTSGETVAHNLASKLGYECIDKEVMRDASSQSGIPLAKLNSAINEDTTLFGISSATKKISMAHLQSALSKRLLTDKVLYHGPFGAFMIRGVSHLLKVRIYAQMDDRIATKVKRDGCSSKEAKHLIEKQDRQYRRLVADVFKTEFNNNDLFDLVINTSRMDAETAVEVIAETVNLSRYKPMTFSKRCMESQALAHRIQTIFVELDPDVEVQAEGGDVKIKVKARGMFHKRKMTRLKDKVAAMEGVENVEIELVEDVFDRILGVGRLR
jgi:cytidylate kinase